jgi:hypothetical protein
LVRSVSLSVAAVMRAWSGQGWAGTVLAHYPDSTAPLSNCLLACFCPRPVQEPLDPCANSYHTTVISHPSSHKPWGTWAALESSGALATPILGEEPSMAFPSATLSSFLPLVSLTAVLSLPRSLLRGTLPGTNKRLISPQLSGRAA